MLLVIDIGNSTTTIGIFDDDRLVLNWSCVTSVQRTEDEWGVLVQLVLQQNNITTEEVKAVMVSSVVPVLNPVMTLMTRNIFTCEAVYVNSTLDLGLEIHYDPPTSVGADRLCAAVAALAQHTPPIIIIDFGTATTFDVIDDRGGYKGGVIAPGVETASLHLHQRAAKLPAVELRFPEKVIGHNTVESMQSGILYGTVAASEGIVSRIEKELTGKATVIATGGFSELIAGKTTVIDHVEPYLILQGIRLIFEKHQMSN